MIEWLKSTLEIPSETILAYLSAVFGFVAIESATALRDMAVHDGKLPYRYSSITYIILRIAFALVAAGPLAVFLSDSAKSAFYIGATAPLIFERLATGIIAVNDGDNARRE